MSKSSAKKIASTKNDLTFVMNTEVGRRIMFWLLDGVCGLHAASYAGGREDTFYREGRRSVGIEVMRALQDFAPSLYRQMLVEALSKLELDKESAKPEEDVDSEEELNNG